MTSRYCFGWLPGLLWAAVIFFFSTDTFSGSNTGAILEPLFRHFFPILSAVDIKLIHAVVRKLGHFSEYFVLTILILNRSVDDNTNGRVVIALVLTVLYAISDEFHQGFVPTRTASIADVTLDIFGALCGALISNIWANCRSATAVVLLGRFRE